MKKFKKLMVLLTLILAVACNNVKDKVNETIVTPVKPTVKSEFVVLHTNDMHGRIVEGTSDGMGLARVDAIVESTEANNKNVLYFDAGDVLHGTVMATLDRGESMVKALNEAGLDAMVPGNHDYNYGIDRLVELQGKMNFPVLAANVINKTTNKLYFKEYTVKEIDGYKVGIFGLSTPETAYKTSPVNIENVTFLDPVTTAKSVVEKLKKENVDYIICLSHLGLDTSSDAANRADNLANLVPEIDLVIDGHSHTTLKTGQAGKDNWIVQTGDYNKNVGKVVVTMNPDGTESENISLIEKTFAVANYTDDPDMVKLVTEVKVEQAKITEVVLGSTDVKLIGERAVVRTGESNLGNYLTDAMLWKTGADIALTNGGGIRASIESGEITRGEVVAVLPFGNFVIVQELKGSDIKAALENGLAGYSVKADGTLTEHGAFAHVAGIKYSFDPSKAVGSRVVNVTLKNGQVIDDNATYKVATNDFIAAGGDKYVMFAGKKIVGNYESLEEILTGYIKSGAKANSTTEGRITKVK